LPSTTLFRCREGVAVVVDGAAAPAAGRPGTRRVGAHPDGAVVAEAAADDGERDADAAQAPAIGADVALALLAAEDAVHHVDGEVVVLIEDAHGRAAHVGAGLVAAVPHELGVEDLEPAAAHEDRAAAIGILARGVAVGEGEVLHREARMILVVAVRRGPDLRRIAGVHVEDAARATAAQRHEPAAVDDDLLR